MNDFMPYVLIGIFAGLLSSCWGSYKDSPFEDFRLLSFVRSIVFGGFLGAIFKVFLSAFFYPNINLGVFFACCVGLERGLTEFWKMFIRVEDQKKYAIPSRLHIFGKKVLDNFKRLLVGVVVLILFLGLFFNLFNIEINNRLLLTLFGFFFGLIGGMAGAFKDAPIEGFNKIKFFRTPLVALFCAFVFSFWESNLGILLLASLGGERMATEFYKSFIANKRPGKFKAKRPVFVTWLARRNTFVLPYAFTWLVFVFLLKLSNF
jgi:hypothetical protein